MRAFRPKFICPQCRIVRARLPPTPTMTSTARATARSFHSSLVTRFPSNDHPVPDSTSAASTAPTTPPPPPFAATPRPTTAPRPNIDIKHIRQNAALYEQNCIERNYGAQAAYPWRIITLFEEWQARQRDGRGLRERSNAVRRQLANPASIQHEGDNDAGGGEEKKSEPKGKSNSNSSRDALLEEARDIKRQLSAIEADEARLTAEMEELALAIPNLTSDETPRGDEPRVLTYINGGGDDGGEATTTATTAEPSSFPFSSSDRVWRSHVHIGAELGILDFAGAATASGWGWYYLLDEGAQLEQALVQYALSAVARQGTGWRRVAPPSIVYSHIAAACGFQPRDQNGEQQVYGLAAGGGGNSESNTKQRKPELSLAGTAEIPLAGMKADSVFESAAADLPCKAVGVSRCYRAEAGARGAETKGLYRVHEFTKVEMFAWTAPDAAAAVEAFDEILDIQTEILASLGLRCRVLEMPSADLGASASRKCDIEAFFPSRVGVGGDGGGWGEVTSASICGDYQTRRLATRARVDGAGRMAYPYTVNGTALAVPRVLAALLENGWDEEEGTVAIPECLRPWMDGKDKIGPKHHLHPRRG
ncbi:Serine--tRNA ligase, mitochondrial [Diatrype stigma]|uniref:serine--tRNA ligase n=1 Tax=Diatrype stigma TaxID=117547 RepID=A0AAN9YRU7_9PEZI